MDGSPLYKGLPAYLLWNPWGLTWPIQTWSYSLNGVSGLTYKTSQSIDAYIELVESKFEPYKLLVDSFVPALNRFKSNHPDVEIIIYNGTAMGCPRFNGISSARILSRLSQSLWPCFVTKCHMAFDSACMFPPDHWLVKYFPTIEQQGLKVYVEAAPWRYDHLRTRGFISALEQLQNIVPTICHPIMPTLQNRGSVGFLDPKTEVKGDRLGALFRRFS